MIEEQLVRIHAKLETPEARTEIDKIEKFRTEDAEFLVVAYGITARAAKEAIIRAREKGIRAGLLRPITLWPSDEKGFLPSLARAKKVIVPELNLGQYVLEVERLAHDRHVELALEEMRKSIWCEGCGLGNLQQIFTEVLIRHVALQLGVDPSTPEGLERIKNNIAMVSGIGCTSRMPGHFDVNSLHTTHGRSLAFATGLKMARPDLTVALVAGDGDIFAIGGNHFIHAVRRNPDLTLIVYDNQSYGMTGSFVAQGAITTTQENQEQLTHLIGAALAHKGFSFVNVRGTCHTGWGSRNGRADAFRYRHFIEKMTLPVERWRELPHDQQSKFIPLGIIHQQDRPDLLNSPAYLEAATRARKGKMIEPLEEIIWKETDPMTRVPHTSIRFAGSGGQGVITAGEIALKAALESGTSLMSWSPSTRKRSTISGRLSPNRERSLSTRRPLPKPTMTPALSHPRSARFMPVRSVPPNGNWGLTS